MNGNLEGWIFNIACHKYTGRLATLPGHIFMTRREQVVALTSTGSLLSGEARHINVSRVFFSHDEVQTHVCH